jgi:hypothetical protein
VGGHLRCFGFFDVDEQVDFADVEGDSGSGYYGELDGEIRRRDRRTAVSKTNEVYEVRRSIPIALTNSSRIQTQTSASSDVSDRHNTYEDHAKDARIQSRTLVLSVRKVALYKASKSEYPNHGSNPRMLSPRSILQSPGTIAAAALVVVAFHVLALIRRSRSSESSYYDKDKSQRTDHDTKPNG